jgi:hypothetical protein
LTSLDNAAETEEDVHQQVTGNEEELQNYKDIGSLEGELEGELEEAKDS